MAEIFKIDHFQFPYDQSRFPGQASDEQILFVTRESKAVLWLRRLAITGAGVAIMAAGAWLTGLLENTLGFTLPSFVISIIAIIALIFILVGWWWTTTLWKKSLAFVTTKRLAKIIYTTPFTRHTLSLPLERIVDTGAYAKGWLATLLGLGTFTARSSATSSGVATDDNERINKKYFYLENISQAEDLQHYVTKLLNVFRNEKDKLENFRPFIPKLKAEAREEFMKKYPQYWS